ncbi:MAG TPA: BhlA/UviB family holin-like peptide [Anaerovoracaceae bacterium]|nr:BhlA/UviB family holin-like peptide [Anaerovoracaceae bacterium]
MESEIIKLASAQGIWAVLAVVLLFYIIHNQEKRDQKQDEREAKYQDLLQNLTGQLNIVKEMKEDIGNIKSYLVSGTNKYVKN